MALQDYAAQGVEELSFTKGERLILKVKVIYTVTRTKTIFRLQKNAHFCISLF